MSAKKDSLRTYRKKRHLDRSPEPGSPQATQGRRAGRPHRKPIFVVQRHQARTLHYDFRLEVQGVLKSWAVPKGPSTDPRVKRLAVMVEDHPLDYADFEGVIPEGQYGAGTVLVWDRGTYRSLAPEGVSVAEALARGQVAVYLEGEKLRGKYALVRTKIGGKPPSGPYGKNWLLIKMKDASAA